MANIHKVVDWIGKESLRVLHQKLNFVGNINRDYDDAHKDAGAKVGSTVRIRQPLEVGTGTGSTMATGTGADSKSVATTLTVNTQRHVPFRFTSQELSQDVNMDYWRENHIIPAMSKLAAKVEGDALSMVAQVPNTVHAGASVTFSEILDGRKYLVDGLAEEGERCALLDSQASVDMVTDTKGLFQDSTQIAKQYREGMMGRHAGFDYYENTLIPGWTSGAAGGTTNYDVKGATQGLADVGTSTDLVQGTLDVDTGTAVIAAGDVFTIADVYAVHPESKTSLGYLKQFTVITGGTGDTTLTISPPIIYSGNYQNVNSQPANNAKITFLGAASTAYKQSVLFEKGFAVFATADLVMPDNTEFGTRNSLDGLSLRILRDYDIVKDTMYTRADILYGYKVLRPSLACKVLHT